jgi:hypothetical protein
MKGQIERAGDLSTSTKTHSVHCLSFHFATSLTRTSCNELQEVRSCSMILRAPYQEITLHERFPQSQDDCRVATTLNAPTSNSVLHPFSAPILLCAIAYPDVLLDPRVLYPCDIGAWCILWPHPLAIALNLSPANCSPSSNALKQTIMREPIVHHDWGCTRAARFDQTCILFQYNLELS